MINKPFRNGIKRVRTYPTADCLNDHILLMNELHINLKKLKRGKNEPKLQWKTQKEDANVKAEFRKTV